MVLWGDFMWIKKYLKGKKIKFTVDDSMIQFNHNDINFFVNEKGNIFVSQNYFGKIPHVMPDGRLCVSGNEEVLINDLSENAFEKTIDIYAPWLFSLENNYKVAEFLNEIDFYLNWFNQDKDIIINEAYEKPSIYKELITINPDNLWEEIQIINENSWYKIAPVGLENNYIYIRKLENGYDLYFDQEAKARMRVVGRLFESEKYSAAFIGVGSVNSYVIKELLSKGLEELVLIDDDRVEVGNMFRYAFPYIGLKKINAAKKYADIVNSTSKIKMYDSKVTTNNDIGLLHTVTHVYISVDNYLSWIEIAINLVRYINKEVVIVFIGIDIFGGYGKFYKTKLDLNNKEKLYTELMTFLEFTPQVESERKRMVGNGCGKSLAVYNESELINLSHKMLTSQIEREVVMVDFESEY